MSAPRADGLVVAHEVELGQAQVRKEDLVRIGNPDEPAVNL